MAEKQHTRRKRWWKLGFVAVIVVVVPWLFLKTVRDALSEPYLIDEAALSGWTLVFTEPAQPAIALVALQPPGQLPAELFQQLFLRTMESMTAPRMATMPVVLQSEYLGSLHTVLSPEEILAVARQAGLEDAKLGPVCLGVKREPDAGRTRQLFFALFEAPAFSRFRLELARLYEARGGSDPFGPTALDPVLPIAASDAGFARWWPIEVNRDTDCQARFDVDLMRGGLMPRALRTVAAAAEVPVNTFTVDELHTLHRLVCRLDPAVAQLPGG